MKIKKTPFFQPIFMVKRTSFMVPGMRFTEKKYPKLFANLRELANKEQVTMEQMLSVLLLDEFDKMEGLL